MKQLGQNVLANEKGWLPVTEEAAIAAKPEVILTNVNYMKDPAKEILARKTGKAFLQFKTKKFSKLTTCLALYQITTLPKH